jgi:SAM-dependent methyltransferase
MTSTSYSPKDYWIEQGKVYKDNFRYNNKFELQERLLVEYLTNNIFTSSNSEGKPVKLSVLEVGCGFGRITRLLLEHFNNSITKYVAVDMSPDQINNAKRYVNETGKDEILKFFVSDIQSLNSIDVSKERYDLVLACEVLLHVLPSEIDQVIRQLTDLSSKHVVNVDWYEEEAPKKIAPHNFIHQYEKIYANIPSMKRVRRIPIVKRGMFSKLDTKQSIFHASK